MPEGMRPGISQSQQNELFYHTEEHSCTVIEARRVNGELGRDRANGALVVFTCTKALVGLLESFSTSPIREGPKMLSRPPQASPALQHESRVHRRNDEDNDQAVFESVTELVYGPNREEALLNLGKKREQYQDLALILWHSHGVMTAILQEIVSVYPLLSPPQLNVPTSNRVSNTLALLQCVASHPDTHLLFLNSHILLFLYPFLNTTNNSRSYEYLRLTSLGVIGALVKNDSSKVVSFLLSTEIIPLCLRIIETTSGISKTVAIFIVQRILQDDQGLIYVCQTYERFFAVNSVLTVVVDQLKQQPQDSSIRLLKHVIMCYQRLADDERARLSLREILPEALRNGTFSQLLREDPATKRHLNQLLMNINQDTA